MTRILKILFVSTVTIFSSCDEVYRNRSHPEISEESVLRGKELAAIHCQSCHVLPDPALLDTRTWEKGVLPQMGPRLGIFEHNYQRYPVYTRDGFLTTNYYPSAPMLKAGDWQNIVDYYMATSPDSLKPDQSQDAISTGLPLFTVQSPYLKYHEPAVCFVKIGTGSFQGQLLVYDLIRKKLIRFNNKLDSLDSINLYGPIVDMELQQNSILACNMGIFEPTNAKYGSGTMIIKDTADKWLADEKPFLQGLARPVQIIAADIDNDRKTDYLVSEFGYLTGSLSWYQQRGKNAFERHVLRAEPGAVKAYVQDYNKDGLPDIWALFAQGEEGIFLFTNKGEGRFDQQQVLRFPPSYGSSSFELVDFNKDGRLDIVYTCGDNADYSTVLKPYHGVYVFMNDGNNRFEQQYFFHIDGCYKALARDFDGDGDLDLACIAYFADYDRHPGAGFVYLEQLRPFEFKPFTFAESKTGRWMTMDAGDLDGNGKTDLVLGNFSIGPVMSKMALSWEKGPAFLVLKNTGKP